MNKTTFIGLLLFVIVLMGFELLNKLDQITALENRECVERTNIEYQTPWRLYARQYFDEVYRDYENQLHTRLDLINR